MKVPMSRLLPKLSNFTFPKLPQLHANKVIHLAEIRSNSRELDLTDKGIPPGEGMFGVFVLNGTQVLVQYIEKLPCNMVGLDSNRYKFVQPLPDPADIRKGGRYTMFVGSSHFLVEIMQILLPANSQSQTAFGSRFSVVPDATSSTGPTVISLLPTTQTATTDTSLPPTSLPLLSALQHPEPASFPLRHKIKRVPVPPVDLQIPVHRTVTTTVDPIPTVHRDQSPPNVNDSDTSLLRAHHGRSLSECKSSALAMTASRDNRVECSELVEPPNASTTQGENQRSHCHTSARVGISSTSGSVQTEANLRVFLNRGSDSPHNHPVQVHDALRIQVINLGKVPPSQIEGVVDEYKARREAMVVATGMKAAPSSPSVRTGGTTISADTKSGHSRSISLVAVPSTRTPKPRPLPGQQSPSSLSSRLPKNSVPQRKASKSSSAICPDAGSDNMI